MIYVNNFRYGKISKKMAGRFDAEQYNQGAFTFRNCRSIFEGGVTRRPPLRHLKAVSEKITSYISPNGAESLKHITGFDTVRESSVKIYVTKGFTVSATISYLLCLGTRTYTGHSEEESVYLCYRYELHSESESDYDFNLVDMGSLAEVAISQDTKGAERKPVVLDQKTCREICFAQYYDRMYVASHEFMTFYFRFTGSSVNAELKPFIFYNDAKGIIKVITNSSRADKGKIVFAHREELDGTPKYYYDTLYTQEVTPALTDNDVDTPDDAYISGFNAYSDNEFNHCKDNYPSIVAVVNDCLWMANTEKNPNAIWKSRVLGTSQWVEGYGAESMHDFSPFQVVSTQTSKLQDVEDWPMTAMRDSNGNYMYHQYGGSDMWYTTRETNNGKSYDLNPKNKHFPHETNGNIDYYMDASEADGGEPYYKYTDDYRLVREGKPWVQYGAGKVYKYTKWYTDSTKATVQTDPSKWSEGESVSELRTLNIEWETKDDGPRNYVAIKKGGQVDPDATSYAQGLRSDGKYWFDKINKIYWPVGEPENAVPNETYGLAHWYDSYDWFKYKIGISQNAYEYYKYGSKDSRFKYTLVEEPVRHKYETYNMSDGTELYKMDTTIDVVATDSCSVRMELNTGKEDAVRFIKAGCDKIVIGTTSAEWTLPAGFNAVSNYSASRYSGYGSLIHEPIELNRSLIILQRGNLLREFYLYQSYLMQREVTGMNHDAIGTRKVVDTISKNAPDPNIYVVLDDGKILYGMYDADEGLNSFADWDLGNGHSFKSVSVVERGGEEVVTALVEDSDRKQYICFFDEHEQEKETQVWADEIEANSFCEYSSEIETSYIEINNQAVMFGRNKKTKGVWLRPYECGRIFIGNDVRQMTLTNYALKDTDYYAPVTGKADKAFSMWLKSYRNEPMNILAFAWEVEQ